MENGSLIGVLAIFTIGAALVIAIAYLGYFLRSPKNREAASRVVHDDKSASTERREKAGTASRGLGSVKERLDHSEASSHPDDPTRERPAA